MAILVLFACIVLSFQLGESVTLCDSTKDFSLSISGTGVNTIKVTHNLDSSQIEINWTTGNTLQADIQASAATSQDLSFIQANLKNLSTGIVELDIEYNPNEASVNTGSTKAPVVALVIACVSFFLFTSKNRIFFTSFLVAFAVALFPLVYGSTGCVAIIASVTVPSTVQQLCIQETCVCNTGWTGNNCGTPVDPTTGTVANPSTGTTRNPSTGTTHNPSTGTTHNPTTAVPTTANPTTANPTTANPTTANPTTANPTTANPTTANPTTNNPTTDNPTTDNPTTSNPTTANPTTGNPTTADPTTGNPTTATTGTTGTTGAHIQIVLDPSFEDLNLTTSPWVYHDIDYPSSQCTILLCGGPSPDAAYDGDVYEWCGGGVADLCYSAQNVTIQGGDAILSIWVIVFADGNLTDYFFVTFDWDQSTNITEDFFEHHTLIHLTNRNSTGYQNWTNIEVEIPPQYKDDKVHTLWVVALVTSGGGGMKWDDVQIQSYPGRTTGDPTTGNPTTGNPTTGNPTTGNPTTGNPTTGNPTTGNPTTADPTTADPTTADPTTANPTTSNR